MIQYNGYKYIGGHNDNTKNYEYDDDYFNSLIRDNRYDDAANYLSNFQFNNYEDQISHLHHIDELRRNGGIIEAMYSRIEDKRDLNTIEFADKVGKPGWYNDLRYKKDASGANVYTSDADFRQQNQLAAATVDILSKIGSSNEHEATTLSVTFSPKKYGWLGIDWLRKDTDDLDEFYNNGGFTKEMLQSDGVIIAKDNKTGETTITFDKTNVRALDILSSLPNRTQNSNQVKIKGYYKDGNGNTIPITQETFNDYTPYNQTSNSFGGISYEANAYNNALAKDIRNIISSAKNTRDSIFSKREFKQEATSTVFDLKTDRTDLLDYYHSIGQLSDSEYNRRMKDAKNLTSWLRAQTYLHGTYSNINNEEYTDEHFEEIGQDEWFKIKGLLSNFDDKDIIIQGQTINGELGLRVTLPQAQRKKRLASTSEGGLLHTDERNIQFFIPARAIPGMLGELQKQIDDDTRLQAIQDFDDMRGYGVVKQLYNGEKMHIDDLGNVIREYNGQVMYDNRPNAKDIAIRDLDETRILEKGKYLKFNYINANGDINYAGYEKDAKYYAIKAGNNLIDAPLEDIYGNSILSVNDDGSINSDNIFINTVIAENYHPEVYNKISIIQDIFARLMNDITNYNTFNNPNTQTR